MNRGTWLVLTASIILCAVGTHGTLPADAAEAGTLTGKVFGRVTGTGKPLAGALVSDGCRVVRTDDQGHYQLAIGPDSGPFVFVTNPAGFWTEAFHVPVAKAVAAGRADFSLQSVEQPERFDFAFITDMHLENRKIGIRKFQMSLREISFLQPRPAFILSQGDICLQGRAGEVYAECLKRAKMPVRTGPGNHEMMLQHKNPRDDFHRLFGPTYYSFDWAGIHCIVLDGNKPIPGGKDWKAVHGAVEGSELAWLRADLAAQPKGKPVIVGIHIPIVTTYPERRKESPPDAPYWEVTNRDVLTELFAAHGVRLVLQGHMHENEREWVKGVEYVASISISGSWYQSGEGMERGVDGTPRGYRIVSVDGTRITHCYRSSCESRVDRQGEWCGLDKPFPSGTQAALVFNCYDAPNGSTAEARIGQGDWQPMPAFAAMDKKMELAMPHHFRLAVDTKALGPGRHSVAARVRWPDGTVITEQGEFTVADGTPSARPAPAASGSATQNWPQLKYDCRHSGDVPGRTVTVPLGLIGAVPATDAIRTSPVVADGRVYVLDSSGAALCIDAASLRVVWRFQSRGGNANCNNVSSPAVAGPYLHFGTMAGRYYVLDRATGSVVREIACGEPIFSTPVVVDDRVYFATLGSQVYALRPDGEACWTWDFVKEILKYPGDRWSPADWLAFKKGRVTWRDTFCTATDLAAFGKTVVVPAGGRTVFLEDAGDRPALRGVGLVPNNAGSEFPASFGQSIGEDGAVYNQWHRRDNTGRVEILRLRDGKVEAEHVPGTQTAINLPGLLSFSSVSVRGSDVFRCRPEAGFGLCKHAPGAKEPIRLGGYPSIAAPILLRDRAVFGGLDGSLYAAPLEGGDVWSFKTAFGKAISASVAVCDGRVYVPCEDGYLYVLGPGGKAPLPTKDLQLWKIRTPLASKLADSRYDWSTNYGNLANTNSNSQGLRAPLKIKWIRRYEGTFKHVPTCGGGRMYTHTAEGQIFAVEQETGRLLWRRYFPEVYLSFTAPIYVNERLLLPQAGMRQSRLRCLNAATGELIWEAPFSGSPSWSRQAPPVVYKNLAIYGFGSGRYAAQGTAKPFVMSGKPEPSPNGAEIMSWIYTHDNPYYPRDNKPLIRAWDIATGREVWSRDFSDLGAGGNDCGLCLLDGMLYYSTFFGYAPRAERAAAPNGVTVALDPLTGKTLWSTTACSVTAGCTISGRDGRLYVGGYNKPHAKTNDRYVRCLDARDGKLIWQSEPVASAVNVVSIGEKYLFANASGRDGYVFDRNTGKILSRFNFGYACTRFTLSEPCVLGCNMDLIDLSSGNRLLATGPALDSRECIGAVVSNGRLFYTAQASGLQVSQVFGDEAATFSPPWQVDSR